MSINKAALDQAYAARKQYRANTLMSLYSIEGEDEVFITAYLEATKAVGYNLLPTEQPVDWTEDFAERGEYHCKCRQCGCDFKGHKTRALCKICALPPCPDIEPIRKLAREVGYAVGEHGSKVRDYDLIAAPWTDEAVGNYALIEHLCKGLNAKVVDGPSRKPCGRYAVCIQISDRWLKHIDLSIMPRSSERESGALFDAAKKLLVQYDAYQESAGNYEEAYYKLAKYAYQHWRDLKAAVADEDNRRRGSDD